MVTEIAYIQIDPSRSAEFEHAVGLAAPYFKSAEGCLSMRLSRVEEDPSHYRLIVGWESVAHHMETFRESENFSKWRELASPFFIEAPRVEHWVSTEEFF